MNIKQDEANTRRPWLNSGKGNSLTFNVFHSYDHDLVLPSSAWCSEEHVWTYKEAELWQGGDSMTRKSEVRITVLKKLSSKEIFGDDPPLGKNVEACPVFEVGQEFIVGEDGGMPKGFCHWAWNDVYKVVTALRYGVNWEPGIREKGAPSVQCCTDGLRPVIFKLERI